MAESIETRVAVIEANENVQNKRIDKLEDQYNLIQNMSTNMQLMMQTQNTMCENMVNIKDDLGNVKSDMGDIR